MACYGENGASQSSSCKKQLIFFSEKRYSTEKITTETERKQPCFHIAPLSLKWWRQTSSNFSWKSFRFNAFVLFSGTCPVVSYKQAVRRDNSIITQRDTTLGTNAHHVDLLTRFTPGARPKNTAMVLGDMGLILASKLTSADDASHVRPLEPPLDSDALCSLKSNMWKSDLQFPADRNLLIHPKTTARLWVFFSFLS